MKRVISLWLPRFATDRLSRPSPGAPHPDPAPSRNEWPLATVTAVHGGQRLAAVNDAAHARGLNPGLPLADARALVPDVRIHPAAPEADLAMLDKLCTACERYTPWAATDPLGFFGGGGLLASMGGAAGLWLDVTGCTHLFGGEEALLADLLARCARAGFRARAGLAATPGAAWALARFGGADCVRAAPGEDRALLKPLPVAALRLDPGVIETLDRMGLRRIEDLLRLPRAPLAQRFGRVVLDRLDQALGETEEPISPRQAPPMHLARRVFAEPIARPEDIEATVRLLLDALCPALESYGLGARTLALQLHHVDNERALIEVGTSRPVRAPDHLIRLFRDKLEGFDPGFGIEVMVLAATRTAPLLPEQDTLPQAADGPRDADAGAARLVDRLAGRLGPANVARLTAETSHLPERACRTRPIATSAAPSDWIAPARRPPRPVTLLPQPLPIEVMAPVPDGPPALFRWRRRSHKVVSAEGPERIAPEWWRTEGTPLSREVRDYYRIEDDGGRRFWVFREGLYLPDHAPGWYLHGFFA